MGERNLHIDQQQWLKELFEYEYCSECGGDAEHHTAIVFFGNWFARCNYSPDKGGHFHPVIKEFRKVQITVDKFSFAE